jgi:hypothetical protein
VAVPCTLLVGGVLLILGRSQVQKMPKIRRSHLRVGRRASIRLLPPSRSFSGSLRLLRVWVRRGQFSGESPGNDLRRSACVLFERDCQGWRSAWIKDRAVRDLTHLQLGLKRACRMRSGVIALMHGRLVSAEGATFRRWMCRRPVHLGFQRRHVLCHPLILNSLSDSCLRIGTSPAHAPVQLAKRRLAAQHHALPATCNGGRHRRTFSAANCSSCSFFSTLRFSASSFLAVSVALGKAVDTLPQPDLNGGVACLELRSTPMIAAPPIVTPPRWRFTVNGFGPLSVPGTRPNVLAGASGLGCKASSGTIAAAAAGPSGAARVAFALHAVSRSAAVTLAAVVVAPATPGGDAANAGGASVSGGTTPLGSTAAAPLSSAPG